MTDEEAEVINVSDVRVSETEPEDQNPSSEDEEEGVSSYFDSE